MQCRKPASPVATLGPRWHQLLTHGLNCSHGASAFVLEETFLFWNLSASSIARRKQITFGASDDDDSRQWRQSMAGSNTCVAWVEWRQRSSEDNALPVATMNRFCLGGATAIPAYSFAKLISYCLPLTHSGKLKRQLDLYIIWNNGSWLTIIYERTPVPSKQTSTLNMKKDTKRKEINLDWQLRKCVLCNLLVRLND